MAVKKTIAIIGADEEKGIIIARRLSAGNYRLLLLFNEEAKLAKIGDDIKKSAPGAEIELVSCMKDGCWEADIIILTINTEAQQEVAEKIRAVAIQKIVACLASSKSGLPVAKAALQQLLPYSKVVAVFINPELAEVFIDGNDDEAVETVALMLGDAGYGLIIKIISD